MCAVDCRFERATRECFLVIRTGPVDVGKRPVQGPFITPDLTVGPDGHPKVTVWNLGYREVTGVTAEFYSVPAGKTVTTENMQRVGQSIPAIIGAGTSMTLTCSVIWPRMSSGDVLLACVSHADLDPVGAIEDPVSDRHFGQMNYAWNGRYEGVINDGSDETAVAVEIRPATKGLYRVKLFLSIGGREPGHSQVDRVMAPNGPRFQWLEFSPVKRDFWQLTILDNQQMRINCASRYLDHSGRPEEETAGLVKRKEP